MQVGGFEPTENENDIEVVGSLPGDQNPSAIVVRTLLHITRVKYAHLNVLTF